jgi:hypothetical protein
LSASTSAKVADSVAGGSESRAASAAIVSATSDEHRARRFRLSKILELAGDAGNARVKNRPGQSLRARDNVLGLFRIAAALVAEARAGRIDLETALHDRRPGDQHAVGMGDRAMALVAGKMGKARAEVLPPDHGVAAVAGMAEIEGAPHRGNVTGDEVGTSAIAVAGEHQRAAAYAFARAVGPRDLDAHDAPRAIREQGDDRGFRQQGR